MKNLDNTIKYYELLMKYDDTSEFKKYELPEGFHYEFYKSGDEEEWVMIHIESGEFTSVEKGLKHFHDFYDSFIEELPKRCVFIVDDVTGEKVGTATISLLKEPEYGYNGAVDWVAIKKRYQGRHLAKPLISKFMEVANDMGHSGLILHTQTNTWLAGKLYLDYGFEILNKEEVDGWSILKTLTDHEKLSDYSIVSNDEIFDKRNIEIERQLIEMYGTENFNYSVWYKNGLHNVYTYLNGVPYEYEYFIEDGFIRLEEVKNTGRKIMIRLVKKSDLNDLAIIYKDLYDNADIGENWTIEKAYELLLYWFDKQKDLFFVAEEDNKPVGAVVSGIKSWFDGLRLIDTEIFVSQEYQGKHIAKSLMLEHLKEAKIKYNVNVIEFHTYGDEDEFPQNWYNRIGFKKDEELIIMSANVENVLNALGYLNEGKFNCESKYVSDSEKVVSCSYQNLSNLYSNLSVGDKAYIFEMLPDYAYQDNDLERGYLESIKNAMKNGAEVYRFIIGSKEKFDNLESNELYKDTISNCYNSSKIYIINEEEIKEKCLDEYFQLAQGLYLGKRSNGKCESFRDLWVNTDNIGLIIRDESILKHIENTVNNIVTKINNNDIKIEKIIEGKVCK